MQFKELQMNRYSKYVHKEHKVGAHLDVQSALALFVVMMGLLFYVDAAPGTHTLMTVLTIAFGIAWYMAHNAYMHWHDHHHHTHH